MHCTLNRSHVDPLAHPTEHKYETNDKYYHHTRIQNDEDVPMSEVTELSGLKDKVNGSQNTRDISIVPNIACDEEDVNE